MITKVTLFVRSLNCACVHKSLEKVIMSQIYLIGKILGNYPDLETFVMRCSCNKGECCNVGSYVILESP